MQPPLVSAIIVNWNGAEYLINCVNSLLQQDYPTIEIIVVDNQSTDSSVATLRNNFPQVRTIEAKYNAGYSGGANIGIKSAAGDYILILNPDIILDELFISGLVKRMLEEEKLGFATGKLYRWSKNKDKILDSTGHIIFRNRKVIDRGEEEEDWGQYDMDTNVFSVCGATSFYRRKMLEDISYCGEYFDEDFFAYKEDVDLCWRAIIFGWTGAYVPNAVAYHYRGWKPGNRKKVSYVNRYNSIKNQYLMMIKNDFAINVLINLPRILVYNLMIFIYILFHEPRVLLVYPKIIKLLPKMLRKRKYIMHNKEIKAKEFRRWYQ